MGVISDRKFDINENYDKKTEVLCAAADTNYSTDKSSDRRNSKIYEYVNPQVQAVLQTLPPFSIGITVEENIQFSKWYFI